MTEQLDEEAAQDLQLAHPRVRPIADGLEVSEQVTQQAEAFAKRADLEHPINRSPDSVAAAALYLSCLLHNEKRTQLVVAEEADVSTVSIRETYQEISRFEGYGLPNTSRNESRRNENLEEPTGVIDRIRGFL